MSLTPLYLLSIFSLAQSAVITRWSELSIGQLGFWRLALAAIVLRLVFSLKAFWHLPKKPKALLYISLSGVSLYFHFYLYFYAAKNTSVAHTLLLFSLNPLFTGLLARWALKETFSLSVGWSFFFGLLSVGALVYPMLFVDAVSEINWGDVAALASGATYSTYIVWAKQAQQHEDSRQVISWSFLVAACGFLLQILWTQGPLLVNSANGFLSLALLVIFPTLLGHAVFLVLSKHLNINWMSVGKLAEPPIATLMAFLVLGQVPEMRVYVAFALLAIALYFLFREKIVSAAKTPPSSSSG